MTTWQRQADNALFWWLLGLFVALPLLAWLYWPRDVPCERVRVVGGEVYATPWNCRIDLREVDR
jgi:hypothetical protein